MPSNYLQRPATWLILSLLVAVLVANTAWLFFAGPGRRLAATRRLMDWPPGQALAWLSAALYLLLPPFAAWRAGVLSPYFLGVTETDWLEALGTAGLLSAAIILVALAAWLVYRRSLRLGMAVTGYVADGAESRAAAGGMERWVAPLDALLGVWHCAFYRAILIGWLAGGAVLPAGLVPRTQGLADLSGRILTAWHLQPVYWGSWLGLAVIALELGLNPYTWRSLRTPGRLETAARLGGLLVATTALFSLTRNLWLCLTCAGVVEVLIAGWFPGEA